MKLPEITKADRMFLHYNPNTDDVVEWIQDYARVALAEKEKECEEMQGLLRRIYDGYGRTGDVSVDSLQEIGFLLAPGKQSLEGDK
jgi:hypothetical protein